MLQIGWLRALATRGYLADQYVHSHGRRVQDVMTRDVITVTEDSSLADIIRVMEFEHFRWVPVVDGDRLASNRQPFRSRARSWLDADQAGHAREKRS